MSANQLFAAFLASCFFVTGCQQNALPSAPVDLDATACSDSIGCGRVVLLVDESQLAAFSGVSRNLEVLKKDENFSLIYGERFYGSALKLDNGTVRLYTLGGKIFESDPDLLRFTFKGYIKGITLDPLEPSVVVSAPVPGTTKFLAAYPDPSVRVNLAISDDGLTFEPLNNAKPVTGRAADTFNQFWFDSASGLYRLSTRTDFGDPGGPSEIRGVRTMVNPDPFSAPTDWKTILEFSLMPKYGPDDRQIYGRTEWKYRDVYFSFAMIFEKPGDLSEGGVDFDVRHNRDVIELYLLSSRDGHKWDFYWLERFEPALVRGDNGAFDKDLIVPSDKPIIQKDGDLVVYYSGANERHQVTSRNWTVGRATWSRDRIVCQKAQERGFLKTVPLRLTQNFLGVNAVINGGLKVWLTKKSPNGADAVFGPVIIGPFDGVERVPLGRFGDAVISADEVSVTLEISNGKVCAIAI